MVCVYGLVDDYVVVNIKIIVCHVCLCNVRLYLIVVVCFGRSFVSFLSSVWSFNHTL